MAKRDIIYFPTQNETKAYVSERAIKTIKTKLYRYFTHKDEYCYLPILQSRAYSYNHTYHRTIGMTPANVKDNNEVEASYLHTLHKTAEAASQTSISGHSNTKLMIT